MKTRASSCLTPVDIGKTTCAEEAFDRERGSSASLPSLVSFLISRGIVHPTRTACLSCV